jgi:hypothetical protein
MLQRNIQQTLISFGGWRIGASHIGGRITNAVRFGHDRLENVISSVSPTVRARVGVVTGAFVVVVVKLLPLCVLRCIWVVGPC